MKRDHKLQQAADLVLNRTNTLGEIVAELHAHQIMLEDLNSRGIRRAGPHWQAVNVIRACITRSVVGLVVAILAPNGHASLGQILRTLRQDELVADLLTEPNPKRHTPPDRGKLPEAHSRYAELCSDERFTRVKALRNQIEHLLTEEEVEAVERAEVSSLTSEIERCVIALHQAIGLEPRFMGLKQRSADNAKLFWDTYIRGAAQ